MDGGEEDTGCGLLELLVWVQPRPLSAAEARSSCWAAVRELWSQLTPSFGRRDCPPALLGFSEKSGLETCVSNSQTFLRTGVSFPRQCM